VKTSLNSPTKLEAERIDKMMQLGCAACAFLGVPNLVNAECHHLLDGNIRLGHWFTIPLCSGHHRSVWTNEQLEWLSTEQRVSIADGRKAFTRIYPTEWQLWDRVQFVMRLDDSRPVSKLVPRGGNLHVDALRSTASPAHGSNVLAGGDRGAVPGDPARLGTQELRLVDPLEAPAAVPIGVRATGRGES
jgi:Recombination enhancement, RecA-dependent nuclease